MRLTRSKNKTYQLRLLEAYPLCQICEKQQSIECHHVRYGRFGADKDDSKQIAVCRECHQWWRRNQELEILQRAGEISELNRQVPFVLMPSYTITDETTKQGFRTIREIRYIADFTYRLKNGKRIIEDVKGVQTEVFKIKRKLLERKIALGVIEGEFRIY